MKNSAVLLVASAATLWMATGAQGATPPRVLGLSEAKVRSANPEAVEELRKAQKLMAQALFHMQRAEELQPGIGDGIAAPEDESSAPVDLGARLSRARGARRSTRGGRDTDEVSVTPTKRPDPDEERRKLDECYDRGKKGAGVLATTLKIVSKIPVVKKFIPGQAGDVADAAGKVGDQVTRPRDGHANINGELKVWNDKAGRWEDF